MTVININELKEKRAERMNQKMADILEECDAIDQDAYAQAAAQAAYIEAAIVSSDATELRIQIGTDWYTLTIIHMDVANEVYQMLENLKKLGGID